MVAQLEHQYRLGKLTLQKLWFFLQPSLHTMERLHRICKLTSGGGRAGAGGVASVGVPSELGAAPLSEATIATGGALLNVIHSVMAKEG